MKNKKSRSRGSISKVRNDRLLVRIRPSWTPGVCHQKPVNRYRGSQAVQRVQNFKEGRGQVSLGVRRRRGSGMQERRVTDDYRGRRGYISGVVVGASCQDPVRTICRACGRVREGTHLNCDSNNRLNDFPTHQAPLLDQQGLGFDRPQQTPPQNRSKGRCRTT